MYLVARSFGTNTALRLLTFSGPTVTLVSPGPPANAYDKNAHVNTTNTVARQAATRKLARTLLPKCPSGAATSQGHSSKHWSEGLPGNDRLHSRSRLIVANQRLIRNQAPHAHIRCHVPRLFEKKAAFAVTLKSKQPNEVEEDWADSPRLLRASPTTKR